MFLSCGVHNSLNLEENYKTNMCFKNEDDIVMFVEVMLKYIIFIIGDPSRVKQKFLKNSCLEQYLSFLQTLNTITRFTSVAKMKKISLSLLKLHLSTVFSIWKV